MPDISLLTAIAELYEITIPEIINGEMESEIMNKEVKEVAEVMADYAGAEKEKLIKDIRLQSIYGVCALAGLVIIDLLGIETNAIASYVHLYLKTLVYVLF